MMAALGRILVGLILLPFGLVAVVGMAVGIVLVGAALPFVLALRFLWWLGNTVVGDAR